jgi:hypothetical protein
VELLLSSCETDMASAEAAMARRAVEMYMLNSSGVLLCRRVLMFCRCKRRLWMRGREQVLTCFTYVTKMLTVSSNVLPRVAENHLSRKKYIV